MRHVSSSYVVSANLLSTGKWEGDHLHAAERYFQLNGLTIKHKRYLDIGANLGYFTLLAASRGYEVTAFEAMKRNAVLLNVSLCANPDLQKLVTLNNVGFADKPQQCVIVSGDDNKADGILRCDVNASQFKQEGYRVRETLQLETMDKLLHEDYFMMKIDIEGSEPQAFAGAKAYFSKHKIQCLLTESWVPQSKDGLNRAVFFQQLASLGFNNIRGIDYTMQTPGHPEAMFDSTQLPPSMLAGAAISSRELNLLNSMGSNKVDFFGVSAPLPRHEASSEKPAVAVEALPAPKKKAEKAAPPAPKKEAAPSTKQPTKQ